MKHTQTTKEFSAWEETTEDKIGEQGILKGTEFRKHEKAPRAQREGTGQDATLHQREEK